MGGPAIVGVVLVRDEELFVERAVRNVAGFCDRIFLVDHRSRDRTPRILERLTDELPQASLHRVRDPAASHELLRPYAGSNTWVFGVDGDELYDPSGLARFRERLGGGEFDRWFTLRGGQLHCHRLDLARGTAAGWLAPPAKTTTKLYNFGLLESWNGPVPERLHGGNVVFRTEPEGSGRHLVDEGSWDQTDFRCLHVCFLHRSSRQSRREFARYDFGERGEGGRRIRQVKRLRRALRLPDHSQRKLTHYAHGDEVEVAAGPFFAQGDADRLPPALVNVWSG
jgi:Glycosyl transferase family 2